MRDLGKLLSYDYDAGNVGNTCGEAVTLSVDNLVVGMAELRLTRLTVSSKDLRLVRDKGVVAVELVECLI